MTHQVHNRTITLEQNTIQNCLQEYSVNVQYIYHNNQIGQLTLPTVEGGSYLDFALKLLQQLKCWKLLEQSWKIINLYDCYSYKKTIILIIEITIIYITNNIMWTKLILLYEKYKIMN